MGSFKTESWSHGDKPSPTTAGLQGRGGGSSTKGSCRPVPHQGLKAASAAWALGEEGARLKGFSRETQAGFISPCDLGFNYRQLPGWLSSPETPPSLKRIQAVSSWALIPATNPNCGPGDERDWWAGPWSFQTPWAPPWLLRGNLSPGTGFKGGWPAPGAPSMAVLGPALFSFHWS